MKFSILVFINIFLFVSCDNSRGLADYKLKGDYQCKEEKSLKIEFYYNGLVKFFRENKLVSRGKFHYIKGSLVMMVDEKFLKNITTIDYDKEKQVIIFHTLKNKEYRFEINEKSL